MTTTATINAKEASVTPAAAGKVYGGVEPALTGSLSGFLAADGVSATYSRTAGEDVAGSPYTISATLNPAGVLANYVITFNTAAFTITPASVTMTWSDPADITYGTALSATQLNATPSVAGTFTYLPAAGSVLDAGSNQSLTVHFVPTDAANYSTPSDTTVHINVLKATASVTLTGLSQTFDDTPKAAVATTDAAGTSSFTVTYDGSSTAPTAVGSYAVLATLINDNYTGTASGTLEIAQPH